VKNIDEFSTSVNNCETLLELRNLLDHADELIHKQKLVIYETEWFTYSNVVNKKSDLIKSGKSE
jgi:hypothetical protein